MPSQDDPARRGTISPPKSAQIRCDPVHAEGQALAVRAIASQPQANATKIGGKPGIPVASDHASRCW